MSRKNDWGFEEDPPPKPKFDEDAYNASVKRYISPISKHDCEKRGCKGRYALENTHEFEEVWDDFKLSQKQRELIFMDVQRSRGRDNRERILIRMFVSTVTGLYILRLESPDALARLWMGDIEFDTHEECVAYYNYCVQLFGFSKELIVRDSEDDESEGFFDDLDELSGAFFDDLDEMDEDEFSWDTDDDDEEFSW